MDGALCRVPTDFFEHIWSILERTPGGIRLCDAFLPQVNFELIRMKRNGSFFLLATNIIGYD
jgi:hypothetical protein